MQSATLNLYLSTDGNDAFEENPGAELSRILRDLADRIERDGAQKHYLRDSNGNRVGTVDISLND